MRVTARPRFRLVRALRARRPPRAGSAFLAALILLAGGCGYSSGSFQGPTGRFAGEHVTVGCLDVGVAATADLAAEGPVIAYDFGNRCDRAARVDFAAVVVRGRTAGGDELELAPYDPDGELRPERIEARRTGREVIEYRSAGTDPVQLVCVDLDGLDGRGDQRREVCVDVSAAGATTVAEVAP